MTDTQLWLKKRIDEAGFGNFIKAYFPNKKLQKITLSVGRQTCPNRDPITGRIGCTYCNNQAFSPDFQKNFLPIREQLLRGIDFFRYKYPTMGYLAYFQSYTSTFGSVASLLEQYEIALSVPGVEGLVVATRPDMMPDKVLDYLQKIHQSHFVLIEYGVESTLDRSLKRVNRGHTYAKAVATIERTAQRGIPIGVHLILGLPGENRQEILAHADALSKLPIDILKLHQLQIIKETPMAEEYLQDPTIFHLFTPDEYASLCLDFLQRLRADIALDRFVSQSPAELLIAPRWNIKNYAFNNILIKEIEKR